MSLSRVDHVAAGLTRVATQFRNSPNFLALLGAFLRTLQTYEDVIVALDAIDLDTAVGYFLRNFGKLVVEPYGDSADDTDYRGRVKAKGVINHSQGVVQDVIAALRAAGAGSVRVRQYQPAAIIVEVGGTSSTAQAATYARTLTRARAAGIGSQLVTASDVDAEIFTLPQGSFLSANYTAAGTTLVVYDTTGTPSTGFLVLNQGQADEETVEYWGKTATSYILNPAAAGAQNHATWTPVIWRDSPGKGLGDSTDPDVGGKLAGVVNT